MKLGQRLLRAWAELAGPRYVRALDAVRGRNLLAAGIGNTYAGARVSRLEWDWIASCIAADEEIKRDAYRLRARARELSRNNALAKQYLRLVRLNTIGAHGFDHQSQVRDNSGNLSKLLNDKIEAGFAEWSWNCSLDGRHGLNALQRQGVGAARCDGEILFRIHRRPELNDYGIALEPIDPDQLDWTYNRVATQDANEVRMGVEIDANGRPLFYHIFDAPYSFAVIRNRERVPASQIIHVYDPDRVNQTRGVTDFHPVTLQLHMLGEYVESEQVASRVGASKTVIWKRIPGAYPAGSATTDENGNDRPVLEALEPGMFGFAPEGYEPAGVSIDHPTTAFESFMRACKQELASGLGVSYAALTSDLSQTSFSSSRTGTQLERDTWRSMQSWWIASFLRPVYRAWLVEAVLAGTATGGRKGLVLDSRDPRRFEAARFNPRGWEYVNPLQDANASVALIENGLWSRTRDCAERGIDIDQLFDELDYEQTKAKELGISIWSVQAKLAAQEALQGAQDQPPPDQIPGRESENGHGGRLGGLVGRN